MSFQGRRSVGGVHVLSDRLRPLRPLRLPLLIEAGARGRRASRVRTRCQEGPRMAHGQRDQARRYAEIHRLVARTGEVQGEENGMTPDQANRLLDSQLAMLSSARRS